jgi:hypothetical protein
MKNSRGIRGPLGGLAMILLAGAGLGSCGDDGTGPPTTHLPSPGQTPVLVSEPVSSEGAAQVGVRAILGDAVMSSSVPSAYVSYAPGSVPGADSVLVTNIKNDVSVGAQMVDGGLDPIPVPAAVGDSLVLEIFSASALLMRDLVTVPDADPPKVVRTSPRRGKTRVPLNSQIGVVFSEPVSPATVNAGTILLLNGTETVPVTVGLDEDGLIVELTPGDPLQAGVTYVVLVTKGVTDRAGDQLAAEYLSEFTTEFESGAGALTVRTVTTNNLDPDGFALLVDGTPLQILSANGSVTIGPVQAGERSLELTGIAPNCQAAAENPSVASVVEGMVLAIDYAVSCTDPPEGRIYFYRSGASSAQISVMNVDGSGKVDLRPVERTEEAGRLVSSPDGNRIAFSDANRNGGLEIYLMDRAGGEVRPLRPGGDAERMERSASWGPSGGEIIFDASDGLLRTDTLGQALQLLRSSQYQPRMPAWSPEGERLAWASKHFGYLLYKEFSRNFSVLREGEHICGGTRCRDDLPVWSPDGTRILFRRIGSGPEYPDGMWLWHWDQSPEELLVEGATWFDWSPDGSRIVYTDAEGIVVMNADGTGKTRIRSLSEHFNEEDESAYSRLSWGK